MSPEIVIIIFCLAIAVVFGATVAIIKGRLSRKHPLPPSSPEETQPRIESDESSPLDAQSIDFDDVPSATEKIDGLSLDSSSAPVDARDSANDSASVDTRYPEARLEAPESVPSRMQRLRAKLARSGSFGNALLSVFSRGDLSVADWEEIEDTLLMADVGIDATSELMAKLKQAAKVEGTHDPAVIKAVLRRELLTLVDAGFDRSLNLCKTQGADGSPSPASVLMVGVNGTGKTTTTGKLARLLVAEGKSVLLGAADTFRAAAAEQLQTWGARVGVEVVRSEREGADPASVAFDAIVQGTQAKADVVLVDTAGRLQNKAGLMDELGKIKRVMERQAPVNEVLLVLDATTGQNGLQQARVFAEVTGVTGIVLSKLDGTAKGGIVISVQRELGVPVKFVGLGEGADDLAPFDPENFVDSLIS